MHALYVQHIGPDVRGIFEMRLESQALALTTEVQCKICQGLTVEPVHQTPLLQVWTCVCVCVCVHRGVQRVAKSSGCALSGFVLVKKVPGTLHFLPKSPGHSFDYHAINMSHQVGYMYYGNKPSPRRRQVSLFIGLPQQQF